MLLDPSAMNATVAAVSTPTFSCLDGSSFLALSRGEVAPLLGDVGVDRYLIGGSVPYPVLLAILAFMMGLGKGGVPGSSTTSVAVNSLLAPPGRGCLDAAVALGVPITFLSDIMVVVGEIEHARWDVVTKLLPSTAAGVAMGTQLMGRLSESNAKLLIGCILAGILLLNFYQELQSRRRAAAKKDDVDKGKQDDVPAYAGSLWFVSLVGIIGGFATILTNSMGPMLNVFLLTLRLEPRVFVGTRATFFTCVNTIKLAQRLYAGTLSQGLILLGCAYGVLAIAGVWASKAVVRRMSKALFMKLEYGLMTFASLKLIHAGLSA
eukprot:TRINITY_DN90514_c0_g1_i1.p1 TRINITY_DN90514_c0_g1~~TRINITY_DN90514_c0_g1_i1.p1  ORF type:complete len:321 (+),score=59.54 TRINITY_DN90514_c0_g1_i1:98-1060(+)